MRDCGIGGDPADRGQRKGGAHSRDKRWRMPDTLVSSILCYSHTPDMHSNVSSSGTFTKPLKGLHQFVNDWTHKWLKIVTSEIRIGYSLNPGSFHIMPSKRREKAQITLKLISGFLRFTLWKWEENGRTLFNLFIFFTPLQVFVCFFNHREYTW